MTRRLFAIVLFILLLAPAGATAAFPAPTGFVNDFAGVLSAGTRQGLESMLSSFEQATGNEVAVATLPSLEGRTVEDVAVELYQQWGIGKKGRDNGALFLVAPAERKMRIEVGYGLEGAINDALAGRILDDAVIPRFKAGDLDAGIAAGAMAIVSTIAAKEGVAFDAAAAFGNGAIELKGSVTMKTTSVFSIPIKILVFLLMVYLFIRHPWLFLLVISSLGRGGGGGSGFGGGFGGFGGGLSGGGGSSRSW